jgi:hypothetical protein
VVAQAALVGAFLPHRPPPDRPRSALGNIYRTSDDRWLQLTVVREDKMNAHGRKTSHYGMAIRGVSVSNEVLGCLIPGEGFGYLAGDPIRRRIGGDVDPQQVASLQADDGQSIEKPEANGRHDEQVDSTDVRHMIVEKGLPALGRWPTSAHHVLGDSRLRDLEAQLEQLTVDARRSPQWVRPVHLANEGAQLC